MITKEHHEIKLPSWDEVNTGSVAYLRGSKRIRKNVYPENRLAINSPAQALKLILADRVKSAVF